MVVGFGAWAAALLANGLAWLNARSVIIGYGDVTSAGRLIDKARIGFVVATVLMLVLFWVWTIVTAVNVGRRTVGAVNVKFVVVSAVGPFALGGAGAVVLRSSGGVVLLVGALLWEWTALFVAFKILRRCMKAVGGDGRIFGTWATMLSLLYAVNWYAAHFSDTPNQQLTERMAALAGVDCLIVIVMTGIAIKASGAIAERTRTFSHVAEAPLAFMRRVGPVKANAG